MVDGFALSISDISAVLRHVFEMVSQMAFRLCSIAASFACCDEELIFGLLFSLASLSMILAILYSCLAACCGFPKALMMIVWLLYGGGVMPFLMLESGIVVCLFTALSPVSYL